MHATIAAPFASPDAVTDAVNIYLLEIGLWPPVLSGARPPLQLYLRYLVTAQASDIQNVHQALNSLAFSALCSTIELESEAAPFTLWQAFGLHPQPSLLIRVAIQQQRDTRPVKLVRQQPELTIVPASELHGVVTDSDNRPLDSCFVELMPLHLTANTDEQGRFRFDIVPRSPAAITIRVRTAFGEQAFPLANGTRLASPLNLRIQTKGD